ncbi:MAG: hypothetical protein AAGA80_02740 [Cyanobacteria bacterium P01_F01_bin.143]
MTEEERAQSSPPDNTPQLGSSSLPDASNEALSNSTDSESYVIQQTSDKISQTNSPYSIAPPLNSQKRNKISEAEERAILRKMERDEKISSYDDWIKFITLKSLGISSLIIGGLEITFPTLLTISLSPPFTPITLVGIGLAILTGKESINLAKTVIDALSKYDK